VKLLFVASEAYPLIKTGGLADVAGTLPEVLRQGGLDVRLLLPAYADLLASIEAQPTVLAELDLAGQSARILETRLPGTPLVTWLVDHPVFSGRPGNPYHDQQGEPWRDNPERFMLLSRAAAQIGCGEAGLDWRADVLHCNDWHTGPAIALASQHPDCPATIFTIHNLAHMGLCDRETFDRLQLPAHLWADHALEFYGHCSFMKGGLVYADYITTVSPGYALEIRESPGGMGLEGLLSARRDRLVGILNGIDTDTWNPATDAYIEQRYDAGSLDAKVVNKRALQQGLGLEERDDLPLLGFVGRLTQQKGLELMLPVLEQILDLPAQLVFLGTGEAAYEQGLQNLAQAHPAAIGVVLAYNESVAHRIEAGADIFLMPSLFEPCGLNQLYSLRYGTPPLVRAVGGLADTVVDADAAAMAAGTATGFVFQQPAPGEFLAAVQRACRQWQDRDGWRALQLAGMAQDFSWLRSAGRYLALYHEAINLER
jgi:starch synthase